MNKEQAINICATLCEPIEKLGLDTRAYNCMKRHGIERIYEVFLADDKELLRIRNCGESTLIHIKERINKYIGQIEIE